MHFHIRYINIWSHSLASRQLPRGNLDEMNYKWAPVGESYCIIFVDWQAKTLGP
jgi:hypothetical protein